MKLNEEYDLIVSEKLSTPEMSTQKGIVK